MLQLRTAACALSIAGKKPYCCSAARRLRSLCLVVALMPAVLSAQGPIVISGAPVRGALPTLATSIQVQSLILQGIDEALRTQYEDRLAAVASEIQEQVRRPIVDRGALARLLNGPAVRAILDDPTAPEAIKASVTRAATQAATVSAPVDPAEYWAGAQMAYKINSDGRLTDNLSVAGHVAAQAWAPPARDLWHWTIKGKVRPFAWIGHFELPFFTNIARPNPGDADTANAVAERKTQELMASSEGVHFGAVPYMRWRRTPESHYMVEVFGSAAWRLNVLRLPDTTATVNIEQVRASGGLRLGIGHMKVGDAPGSLAVEYFRVHFLDAAKYRQVFGVERSHLSGVETNFVLPLGDQLAVQVNHVAGVNAGASSFLRLGLIVKRPDA